MIYIYNSNYTDRETRMELVEKMSFIYARLKELSGY